MGAGALAPGRVCTEFPKDKEFRAFEMLEKIDLSSKPRRCAGCRVASHAQCFTIDQDRWPSVMGGHNGVTLRRRGGACGTWVCPMHMVRGVFSRHGGGEPPPAAAAARTEELEHVRQFFWFYSRSAAATVNNISSAVGRIRKFEAEMGLPCVPSV
jgi:hypothetical protein